MNKKVIDKEINIAYRILNNSKIVVNETIDKAYRSQISSFGSAIVTGSVLSAIAFFSSNGESKVNRKELIDIVFKIISENNKEFGELKDMNSRLKFANNKKNNAKEELINSSIALKLAMSLFELKGTK